jgi:hypothetical protein
MQQEGRDESRLRQTTLGQPDRPGQKNHRNQELEHVVPRRVPLRVPDIWQKFINFFRYDFPHVYRFPNHLSPFCISTTTDARILILPFGSQDLFSLISIVVVFIV